MKTIEIDAMSVFRSLTLRVRVRLSRLWRVRFGLCLIRAGSAIAGCGLEIEASPGPGPNIVEIGIDGAGIYLKVENDFPATIDHSGLRFTPDPGDTRGGFMKYRPETEYQA